MSKTVREILQAVDSGNATILSNENGATQFKLAVVQNENIADRYINGMVADGLIKFGRWGDLQITERGRAYAQGKIK